jgi:MFS family permease
MSSAIDFATCQVFTGFGVSAFLAPVVAGALYDRFRTYTVSMNVGAVLSLVSIAVLCTLPDYFE